MASHS